MSIVIATTAAYAAHDLAGRLAAARGGAWTTGLVGDGISSSACRIALIALVVSGMAAIPAAAQAGATAVVSATVVDLREARATVQAAHGLAAGLAARPATSLADRRDLSGATVFVSLREHAVPGRSPDAAIATVIYW